MSKILSFLLILLLTTITQTYAQSPSQSCNNYVFKSTHKTPFKTCVDLPVLYSFLHYNYYPSSSTLEIAYRHANVDPNSWVSWAINPEATKMVGCQSLVAYSNPKDGSMVVYTSPITSYDTDMSKGDLSFNVTDLSAVRSNNEVIIFATLKVPNNATELNQVWQDGPLSDTGKPRIHSLTGPNVRSMAKLNVLSGVSTSASGGNSYKSRLKNVHGVVNGISWGIMMPMGAIIARYMKVFPSGDPAWFYLHVGCQLLAYVLGVAGWATGLKLGSLSHRGIVHSFHWNIGLALFILATIQLGALAIRPKKDHKYRFYWNVYHHSFGYTIIILSIINIFEGFRILHPKEVWKSTYIGIIVALGVIALLLEALTWFVVFRRKKSEMAEERRLPLA